MEQLSRASRRAIRCKRVCESQPMLLQASGGAGNTTMPMPPWTPRQASLGFLSVPLHARPGLAAPFTSSPTQRCWSCRDFADGGTLASVVGRAGGPGCSLGSSEKASRRVRGKQQPDERRREQRTEHDSCELLCSPHICRFYTHHSYPHALLKAAPREHPHPYSWTHELHCETPPAVAEIDPFRVSNRLSPLARPECTSPVQCTPGTPGTKRRRTGRLEAVAAERLASHSVELRRDQSTNLHFRLWIKDQRDAVFNGGVTKPQQQQQLDQQTLTGNASILGPSTQHNRRSVEQPNRQHHMEISSPSLCFFMS
ncbi:hypothetical protein GLAREA_04497 [Glarea lozoyensis ATCC 20868]|uniref:Uncharacterized protein n=1 Tax=Glarea lozoyensis (strain ATCC 20868 / MF5171) TaxID=1116229 RepID=S3D6Q2_GLAL2|nr:uncharacterized protein GLAREA_04497 [Glarea lozoyensis ATCC 20868]EPE27706.1 hypothetical protein GLAREA_04497 [Glarea lozoyensis ATCC 20868]